MESRCLRHYPVFHVAYGAQGLVSSAVFPSAQKQSSYDSKQCSHVESGHYGRYLDVLCHNASLFLLPSHLHHDDYQISKM